MDYKKQSHAVYYTRYHIVVATKYRRKILRKGFGEYLKKLVIGVGNQYPEIEVIEVNTDVDHIHILLSVPPKYSIAMAIGYLKGKSSIRIHRELFRTKGTLFGRSFWSRGYCVSTVGLNESFIRKYIQEQEKHDRNQEN